MFIVTPRPSVAVVLAAAAWLFPAVSSGAVPLSLPDAVAPAATVAPAKKDEFTAEVIGARREALQKEITATRTELVGLVDGTSGDAERWLTQETALLERIDAVYAEQQRTWQHASDLAKEAADVEDRTRNRRPPEASLQPPYDIVLLDQLYGERDYLGQAGTSLKRDLVDAEARLQEARDTLEEKDRERRAVRAVEAGAKMQGNRRLAEIESRLAQATLLLRERALKTLKLQQSLLEPKRELLRPRIEWLRANLSLGTDASAALRLKNENRVAELERAIVAAREDAEVATQVVIATERRATVEKIADELASRRASRQSANLSLSVLTAQRERLAEQGEVAELRRRVLSGGLGARELRALAEQNQTAMDKLARERRHQGTELFRSRREMQDWQVRLASGAAADEKAVGWSVERMKRLAAWIELNQREVAELDRLGLERGRLKEEIGERVSLFSWRDASARLRDAWAGAWNYEVFSVKDQPVRVKSILSVLLLIVLGYHASRWLSGWLSRVMFRKKHLDIGRRAAWQTLWFYGLFIVVLVVAFDLFHISFTQFSVVSGALAVGIGFGSQNLISNFISGIILLIERPVNQGDVIEIDGRQVTVERLGARSTIVRTLDNTHLIVPNSRLLEQPVLNWTLSDDVVRKHLRVGVAYDSPTRKVAELLQGILTSVESVRPEPAPVVKFADFGDSSLIFELYFWVSMASPGDAENELRHRIAEVFAREKIVMAFPQRDVHLETTKPLQVVITHAGEGDGAAKPAGEPKHESRPV